MIHLPNNSNIIESLSELPNLKNRKEIFCDIESKRVFQHKDLGGLYPWKGDRICGFSITADDIRERWYIPIRHTAPNSNNLPVSNVMNWIQDILQSCKDWINHNIKFDALMFAVGDNVEFKCRLIDTLTQCKLYYSDRIGYGLKPVCKDWLDYDVSAKDRVAAYLKSIKSKSYADVPIDILGEYANDDIGMNRELYRFLQSKLEARIAETKKIEQAEAVKRLVETEINLTSVLFDIEKDGLRVDEIECKKASLKALRIMIDNATRIADLTGREFINSNNCIYDIFINQLNLPILKTISEKKDGRYYDTGRPSFDKDAMALYRNHPLVVSDPKIKEIVNLICEYRIKQQFKSLYLDTFLELNVDGIIHPNYNQAVRTGRLSSSKPNSQQQNEDSKVLLHPFEGEGFISNDYSQIEYRLIVHYAKIEEAIKAYNENPETDYHQWVADLIQIIRKPAKQLNFGMAYGQGKNGVTAQLMSNDHIIEMMTAKVAELIASNKLENNLRKEKLVELCRNHAEYCWNKYHDRFPEIKTTSDAAKNTAAVRGFVFNAYGRRRYLPGRVARKAFNSIIQSCAADIMKERMVAISPRFNSESKKWGIKLAANVHDELLSRVPLEVLYESKLHNYICNMLETTTINFKVPILTGLGISPNNWAEAAGDKVIKTADGKFIAGKIR
jgi:DNA polymerase-1